MRSRRAPFPVDRRGPAHRTQGGGPRRRSDTTAGLFFRARAHTGRSRPRTFFLRREFLGRFDLRTASRSGGVVLHDAN